MLKSKIFNLQLFADSDNNNNNENNHVNNIEALIDVHANELNDLGDTKQLKDVISKLNGKLQDLGYDILINNKQKSNYVPISRLNEVISQRDNFKTQVQELNTQLETIKDNDTLKQQLQDLQNKNTELINQIEQTKLDTAIILAAKDAINPQDVLVFIDKSKIKIDKNGNFTNIDEIINELRQSKPYLFNQSTLTTSKAGLDNKHDTDVQNVNMNDLIRRAIRRI
jgi:hypothetical protein